MIGQRQSSQKLRDIEAILAEGKPVACAAPQPISTNSSIFSVFSGGIYIDLDTIAVNSFDPLRNYSAVQGADYFYSLANGILIGAPQNLFHLLFYLSYLAYNPKVPPQYLHLKTMTKINTEGPG